MKIILLLLMPIFCFGQQSSKNNYDSLKITSDVRGAVFATFPKVVDGHWVIDPNNVERRTYAGRVKFVVNDNIITSDSAVYFVKAKQICAFNAKISNRSDSVLKCNFLAVSQNDENSIIHGNITIDENGTERPIAQSGILNFYPGGYSMSKLESK